MKRQTSVNMGAALAVRFTSSWRSIEGEAMDEKQLIVSALENPAYDWRTLDGIAKETGLAPEKIIDILSSLGADVIRRADPDDSNRFLYTTRRHYRRSSGP